MQDRGAVFIVVVVHFSLDLAMRRLLIQLVNFDEIVHP